MPLNSHYACDNPRHIKHHRRTCPASEGHDPGVTTLTCRACRKMYLDRFWTPERRANRQQGYEYKRQPPKRTHYDCPLSPADHPPARFIGRNHRPGCRVAAGHRPGPAGHQCPECQRLDRFARTELMRGLEEGAYLELFAKQGGRCAICTATPKKKRFAIDHDHATGTVRGLLCDNCNNGLGRFGDSPELLATARDYLLRANISP